MRKIVKFLGLLLFPVFVIAQNPNIEPPEGMIFIPEGDYEMGIPDDSIAALAELGKKVPHMNISHAESWFGDERTNHLVKIAPFFLDKYEVTNEQFQKFVQETDYKAEGDWQTYATTERMLHPVVCVTWNDATAFAAWAGKRLPTEVEWEYAAKGGKNLKWFSWGEKPDNKKAQWRHQGESFWDGLMRLVFGRDINTVPVGSFVPNGYGLYDMIGNVREWCSDSYAPYPGLQESDWKHTKYRPFADSAAIKKLRISRGGHWDSPNPVFIRLTRRQHFETSYFSYHQGFRCARSIP